MTVWVVAIAINRSTDEYPNYAIPDYVFVLDRLFHLIVLRKNEKNITLYNYMCLYEGLANMFTVWIFAESIYYSNIAEAVFVFAIRQFGL